MPKEKIQPPSPDMLADIVIAGGGIAGLTLAAILGTQSIKTHLIEPFPPQSLKDTPQTGRTVALMVTSLNVLKAAGMEEFCQTHGTKMETMRIMDDSIVGQKTLISEFDARNIGLDYFSMNIPNNPLRAALFEKIQSLKSVTIHTSPLADFTVDTKIRAGLEDGTKISAPLIIGADGRKSLVRAIAGIKSRKKDYGQSAITCVINHSRTHNNTSTEFHRSSGPFALVPMQGNQSSVVWVEKTDKANEFMHLSRDSFEQAVQERTKDILGGITLETPPECWPLCSIRAQSMTAARVALIAEAAHVMSPITAQGLNLSLRDVAALAETIVDAMRIGIDHGSQNVLHLYESRRSLDVSTRVFGVNSMNQIVSNDRPAIKDLRRAGLKIIDRYESFKTFAMRHGLAPSLDQGRLVRGERL